MLDNLFWLAVTIYIIYLLNSKFYIFKNEEKEFEDICKDLKKDFDDHSLKSKKYVSQFDKDLAKKSENRFKKFVKTHDDYLHLRERYKHEKEARNIRKDYFEYLKAIKDILGAEMDFGALDDEKLLDKAGDKFHKAEIVISEVEIRFNKLMKASKNEI